VTWVGAVALLILFCSLLYHLQSGVDQPPGLIAILTPANLFTGVLGCGIVCLLNVWMDRRFLPRALQMNLPLFLINIVGGTVLVALGLKAYGDDRSRVVAFAILSATLASGLAGAYLSERIQKVR
jgi:hypothetical protein